MDDSDNARNPNPELIPVDGARGDQLDPWMQLRGALKDVYAQFGGGEAYLLREREEFNRAMEVREQEIERVRAESKRGS